MSKIVFFIFAIVTVYILYSLYNFIKTHVTLDLLAYGFIGMVLFFTTILGVAIYKNGANQ